MSVPLKTTEGSGLDYPKNVLQQLTSEYTKLRVRAGEITMEKPRLPSPMKNWTNHLDNVFNEGERTIQAILGRASNDNNNNKDYKTSLSEQIQQINCKLQVPGTEIVAEVSSLMKRDCLEKYLVEKFWNEKVKTFIVLLLSWVEGAILKVASGITEEKKRNFVVQDILDQGKDLLWGIYS